MTIVEQNTSQHRFLSTASAVLERAKPIAEQFGYSATKPEPCVILAALTQDERTTHALFREYGFTAVYLEGILRDCAGNRSIRWDLTRVDYYELMIAESIRSAESRGSTSYISTYDLTVGAIKTESPVVKNAFYHKKVNLLEMLLRLDAPMSIFDEPLFDQFG